MMDNPQRLPRSPYKREKLGIVVGMLLGDSCITKRYRNKLILSHVESFKAYFDWKCDVLESLGFEKMTVRHGISSGFDKKTPYLIVDFKDKLFEWFYAKFYGNDGKRRVSRILIRHLNTYGLAIWFMDDGWNNQSQTECFSISLGSYGDEEQINCILQMLKVRFGLTPSVQKDGDYKKLYFGTAGGNAARLKNLVWPYIHPSMRYKLCSTWHTDAMKI